MANLQFIKSAEATGTSSISITDCFSSTYDIYAITLNNFSGSSGNPSQISIRFINTSDSPISTSNYDTSIFQLRADSSFVETKAVNQTDSELFGHADFPPESSSSFLYIFNPINTSYTFFKVETASAVSGVVYGFKGQGVLTETTSVSGIQFLAHANNFDSGKINIFGVKE